MKDKVYVNALEWYEDDTMDVYTSVGQIPGVPGNVVRCALGSDVEYLLDNPINAKEWAFPLLENEYEDFLKYSDSK